MPKKFWIPNFYERACHEKLEILPKFLIWGRIGVRYFQIVSGPRPVSGRPVFIRGSLSPTGSKWWQNKNRQSSAYRWQSSIIIIRCLFVSRISRKWFNTKLVRSFFITVDVIFIVVCIEPLSNIRIQHQKHIEKIGCNTK